MPGGCFAQALADRLNAVRQEHTAMQGDVAQLQADVSQKQQEVGST
jgi:hypothetical protein